MAPQQNSKEKVWSQKENEKSNKKGRSMPVIEVVRSVRSGHLIMLFFFLLSRSDGIKTSEVRISVGFGIRS